MSFSDGLDVFAGQTAGGLLGYQNAALSQQMQQFMLALQFQQQQAAQSQAANYGTQFGFAPGGNWMQWGAGGPSQPPAGTPTQQQQSAAQALLGSQLQNALAAAGVTGQFAQPAPNQFAPGTVLTAPSNQPGLGNAYGIVNQDGSVQMVTTQALDQLARQRGTTAQAMINQAAPTDWNTLQRLSQGPPTGPAQQTQQAQQQAYNQALQAGQLTGTFTNPNMTPDALLQQGMNMAGKSFNSLPPDQQQFWLQYNQNNPQAAAQQWARAENAALQQAGYQNPSAQGQQTLASILQNAQLSGMYQGAPTEVAREFNQSQAQQLEEFYKNLGLQQGQLGQQYLSTAAQLQGPQNTFQLSNYLRGAASNPNVPVYLQSLQNNLGLPSFQATGGEQPTPASMGGLAAGMGGGQAEGAGAAAGTGGATSGWNYANTLDAIKGIASRGAQALGPGSLERLSPDELQAFGSGLGAAGYSLPSFMSQYSSSRVGQQAPVARTSLF